MGPMAREHAQSHHLSESKVNSFREERKEATAKVSERMKDKVVGGDGDPSTGRL